jgi:hypothetical protein
MERVEGGNASTLAKNALEFLGSIPSTPLHHPPPTVCSLSFATAGNDQSSTGLSHFSGP